MPNSRGEGGVICDAIIDITVSGTRFLISKFLITKFLIIKFLITVFQHFQPHHTILDNPGYLGIASYFLFVICKEIPI